MGYQIQSVLSYKEIGNDIANQYEAAHAVHLYKNIVLIPLTDQLFDEINQSNNDEHNHHSFNRFFKLTPKIKQWLELVSTAGLVSYIEAEYFGGTGGQAGVVWERGKVAHGPEFSDYAINKVLRYFGVNSYLNAILRRCFIYKHYFRDEFDIVGLGRFRETDEWLSQKPGITNGCT